MRYLPLVLICLLVAPLSAQVLPLETVEGDASDYLVTVPVAHARCVTVSDPASLIVFGIMKKKDVDLAVYTLDKQGTPSTEPVQTLNLPRPEGFPEDRDNYVLSLQAHPTLPLIYAWQDVPRPREQDEQLDKVYHAVENLVIYRVANGKLSLAQSIPLGHMTAKNHEVGEIELNVASSRLYIPNLRAIRQKRMTPGAGFAHLGEDGLVIMEDGQPKLTTVFHSVFGNDNRSGGFAHVNDDIVIVAGQLGPLTWNINDASQRFFTYCLWPARYNHRVATHPTLPRVYLTSFAQGYIRSIEHADGYPTLMPQIATLSGPFTRPIVLPDRQLLAIGGTNLVSFIHLDDEGRLAGRIFQARINNRTARALTYSKKFDKLYVGVEVKP